MPCNLSATTKGRAQTPLGLIKICKCCKHQDTKHTTVFLNKFRLLTFPNLLSGLIHTYNALDTNRFMYRYTVLLHLYRWNVLLFTKLYTIVQVDTTNRV